LFTAPRTQNAEDFPRTKGAEDKPASTSGKKAQRALRKDRKQLAMTAETEEQYKHLILMFIPQVLQEIDYGYNKNYYYHKDNGSIGAIFGNLIVNFSKQQRPAGYCHESA